jgi:hypothetical protein
VERGKKRQAAWPTNPPACGAAPNKNKNEADGFDVRQGKSCQNITKKKKREKQSHPHVLPAWQFQEKSKSQLRATVPRGKSTEEAKDTRKNYLA